MYRNFRTNKHEVSLANYKSIRSRFKKPLNNSEVLFEPMDRGKVQTYLPAVYIPHFLYRFLDGKKTSRSQFSILGLREIHKKLNQEINFNSRVSFFRKSLGQVVNIFFCCHFHDASKEWMFLAKIFFEFHAQVQKCHFGNFSFLPCFLVLGSYESPEGLER